MKLLLVDDEPFTRNGILKSIPWSDLRITEVEVAEDGLDALSITQNFLPDIVLSDVRMPRMDGIEMSFQLRKRFPYCEIIFMSGFSEKSYLKSAIQLGAVSYIDKPFEEEDLIEALKKAFTRISERTERNELSLSHAKRLSTMQHELALSILRPAKDSASWEQWEPLIRAEQNDNQVYRALLFRYPEGFEDSTSAMQDIEMAFQNSELRCFFAQKDQQHIIALLVGTPIAMQKQPLDFLFANKGNQGQGSPFHQIVAAGKMVPSFKEAYHSYLTSVLCLQRAFYHDIRYMEYNEDLDNHQQEYPFSTDEVAAFAEYLSKEDLDGAMAWIKSLGMRIRQYDNTQVAVTKDFYLSLLLKLVKVSEERGIFLHEQQKNEGYGYEALLQCHSLSALEASLLFKLEQWKTGRNEPGPHAIVSGIHKLIAKHYPNDSLTIKDLSKELYLSTAYLCVVYKEHTGRTILQHLTEYRIDQAKQLLSIPRIKVIDVAKQVGYSNAVYFAKTFRKHTGLTPSEYRERITL